MNDNSNIRNKSKISGLGTLKPFRNNVAADPIKHNEIITAEYNQFIKDNGPFFFWATLTFGKHVSFYKRCRYTNELFHRINQRIFHRDYKKHDDFVEGFAIVEDHFSPEFEEGKAHIHMLIKGHEKYYKYDFTSYNGVFRNMARKIKSGNGQSVFSDLCIDIKNYRDEGAVSYGTKKIWSRNLHRIKPIGKDGLSDNLSDRDISCR